MFNALKAKQAAHISMSELEKIIKHRLIKSPIIRKICEDFEIDPERINDLRIEIHDDLDDRYAETDAEVMKLNKSLFEGDNFFEDYFFVVAHEIVHYLSRIKEQDAWFHDPEEVLGFTASIGYEIENGTDFDIIWNRIYPKISWHFHNEEDSKQFFQNMYEKAIKILNQ